MSLSSGSFTAARLPRQTIHTAEPLCHSRVSAQSNKQNWPEFCPGNAWACPGLVLPMNLDIIELHVLIVLILCKKALRAPWVLRFSGLCPPCHCVLCFYSHSFSYLVANSCNVTMYQVCHGLLHVPFCFVFIGCTELTSHWNLLATTYSKQLDFGTCC